MARAAQTIDPELRAAFAAEHEASVRLRQARARVADLVGAAIDNGATFDSLACAGVRARTGRAASIAERRRESARLRQLVHRANNGHTNLVVPGIVPHENELLSPGKEIANMNNPGKLVERTTTVTTEKFLGEDLERDDDEDLDDADEKDDKPSRRRSR